MRFFFSPQINSILRPGSALGRWSFGKFLVLFGTCSMGLLLMFSFLSIYNEVSSYLGEAFSRNAQTRTLAQADAISGLLDDALLELEYLSRNPLSVDSVVAHLNKKSVQERNRYGEVAFWGTSAGEHFVLVNTGDTFVPLPPGRATTESEIFTHIGKEAAAKRVLDAGEPVEIVYTGLPSAEGLRNVSMHVVRLTLPVMTPENRYQGHLVLSVNLLGVRDILSLYISERSPLYLAPQSNERKTSFVFDLEGWLLFESENIDDQGSSLSVDKLRVGLQGDVGRPGFKGAFRPASFYQPYWTVVTDVRAGHAGQVITSTFFSQPEKEDQSVFLSYAPIIFHGRNNNKIIGGIGYFDGSYVFSQEKKVIYDFLFWYFWTCIVIISIILFFIGRSISKNIKKIHKKIENKVNSDDQSPLDIYSSYDEINSFQKSINILLLQLYMARREISQIYAVDREDRMRYKVDLDKIIDENTVLNKAMVATPLHGIVGGSIAVAQLRQQIHKAASVLADVLIIGETGTGKELTAAAVHAMSYRAKGPFISISCGALDENLLMDALFGHVKGAYSEAYSDRKGAFWAASGGTLLLDEIGNASPKVQQALLRALSVRRIVPLGSDQEVAFDTRIIAITNVDLLQATETLEQSFRDDLYYRLAVLTINTPPLRNRKEDLPVLVRHFLEINCRQTRRAAVGVSRGALDKLLHYDWPGNVRELEHCLIRSLAFVDGDVLLAEHILFNEPLLDRQGAQTIPREEYAAQPPKGEITATGQSSLGQLDGLNERQLTVWPLVLRQGSISRSEYQQALNHTVSVRTAQYDLYDFVSRGVLVKSGRGPSCRYKLVS